MGKGSCDDSRNFYEKADLHDETGKNDKRYKWEISEVNQRIRMETKLVENWIARDDTNKRLYKLRTVRGKLREIYISEIFPEKIVSDTGMKWKVRRVDK